MTDQLDALNEAVQTFATHIADEPELVSHAIVVWEAVSYSDDGEVQRCIRYAVPTDNFTLSGTLGLLEAGNFYVRRDMLRGDEDDD